MQTKWIIVSGGIMSGLGKGTATASIGRLVKDNRRIITIKCDGYLNVDPGTINPIEHGEVFVLDDGGEVDMDYGHYERFLDINCKSEWNLTSGKIFNSVIEKERKGVYLGKTIQIFPHVIEEIKGRFHKIAEEEKADIVMIEIGGTIGDIENSWFVEAVRQLKKEVGNDNIMYIHLTYIPYLHSVGELKTKPAQRDIALLREKGISPDVIIGRCKYPLTDKIKQKIAMFCDIELENIIAGVDIESIYEIPVMFKREGMLNLLNKKFGLNAGKDFEKWEKLVKRIKNPKSEINIAICGKYTALKDSYASIIEALNHAGAHLDVKVNLNWLETTDLEKDEEKIKKELEDVSGVIVPGGFGIRGTEGKIAVIKYVRENKIPFLGLCYGLQLAVVEFARTVCGLKDANTTENVSETKNPVIDILPEQKNIDKKGATMRLGGQVAELKKGSLTEKLYESSTARERHRHRFEVNPEYHEILQKNGLVFSGMSKDKRLVEYIELNEHPFFIATQSHPELTSRLERPNPLFFGFVKAAVKIAMSKKQA